MPRLRLDNLPMHQVQQSRGDGGLYARYETDPEYVHETRRRPGSERQARYADALGVVCTGRASRLTSDRTYAVAGGWTAYLSVMVGDVLETNVAYPLVTLRASRTGASTTDSFRLYAVRTGTSTYRLGIKAINGTPATMSSETFALTINTDYHLAFRWSGTALSITDGTTTKTITPGGVFTGPYYIDVGGDKFTASKPRALHPVIANFSFDTSYISFVPSDLTSRTPSMDYHWLLDGADGGSILSADTGTALLYGYPAAPQLVDGALQFSSESGALQVEHSTDYDRFWTTALRSVGQESFTFCLVGTRGQEVGREMVLLDYGDLGKLVWTAGNVASFTYNGVTVADGVAITAGTAFTIFCGRSGSDVVIQVGANVTTNTAPAVPFLDFERIPNIYLGADEDPAVDKFFTGSLTKWALFPFSTRKDAGADQAAFYFDFTGDEIIDTSLNSVAAFPLPHTDEAGEPLFARGPLTDGSHLAVEGGVVLGHSGPVDFDNLLRKRMGSDAVGLRVGYRSFITSGERAHVVNHLLDRTRPLGLPKPGADVTVQAVGTGALDGAYAYGYQFQSADGTVSPLKRLNPVAATDGARVILGSSDGAENEVGTELDESYGTNYVTTPAASSRFKGAWDSTTPTAGTYTTEVRARLRDITEDDLKEKVHHRAVTAADGAYTTDTLYFSTDIATHSFNINGNWTVQTVFEYHHPRDYATAMTGWGLWGVGKTERLTGGTTYPSYNQDFVAYFLDGENDAGDLVSNYYTTTEGKGAHYGDGTSPKLVVGWPRQERRESWYNTGRRMALNYALLTFSNDPDWTEGSTYDVIFKRSGQALEVYYRNLTAGETAYTQLTARNMTALPSRTSGSGKTVAAKDAYTGSNFFVGYSPKTDARDFHFGTAMDYHLADMPFITSVGQANEDDYQTFTNYAATGGANLNLVKPAPGGTTGWKPMHYRVWNRVLSTPDLERHSIYRSAALPGEPLNYGIFIDLGCVLEVESASSDKLTDKASGMVWFAKNEQGTGAARTPSAETLAFAEATTAALNCPRYPLACFGTDAATFAGTDLKLYCSPLGDGSYTLQSAGTGAFNLRRKIWATLTADPLTTKLIGDFQTFMSDFDQFKWHSFGLVLKDGGGGNYYLGADSWAVNGNTIFKSTIGATSAETVAGAAFTAGAGWIRIAGFMASTTPSWPVDVSEFRIWSIGSGPDVEKGTDFKYLLGRVSENELGNLQTYIKFQPDDEVVGGTTTVEDYGVLDNDVTEEGNADVVDTRTNTGSGSDPAPKTSFPGAPFEDVTRIVISRSRGIPINDPDDETEVQTALNAARGVPLYRLAAIPVGSTHYVDASPDDLLLAEVPADTGQVPQKVTAAYTWQGHLGLLTGDYDLWFSEGGPYGWETFPNWLRHRVPVTTGGGEAVAACEANGVLFIFGREWAVAATGHPTAPDFTTIGAGCGAYAPRCVTAYANMVFAYNGTLWALADGQPVNFGLPVHDLLPAPENARLSTSSALKSLFLIDETTGVALRYHIPTQRWSVEERDAVACGDLTTNTDAWATVAGAWAQGSTTVYGDDVNASTSTERAGTVSGDTVTLTSGTVTAPAGLRCSISQQDGTCIEARIESVAGTPSVVTFDDLTGVTGQVMIRFGAGSTGLLLDAGILDLGNDDARGHYRQLVHILEGSGWEFGRFSSPQPGDPADRDSLEYTSVAEADERLGDGSRLGRFQRCTFRNRIPESSRLTYAELAVAGAE